MKYLGIFLGLVALVFFVAVMRLPEVPFTTNPQWTVAFAASQARYLGLDPKEVYQAILTQLKPTQVRLQANWDEIESQPGQYDFSKLDWYVDQAAVHGVSVTMAVGRKLPHWPECHDPGWLSQVEPWNVDTRVDQMLTAVVQHYKSNAAVVRWQLENEPLFGFGNCPPPSWHQFKVERELLRSLDTTRPVLVTDAGELSPWWETARFADVQGTTLYRVTWNSVLGYSTYPWPPLFYRLKAALVSFWVKKVIVSELQMEPWAPNGLDNVSVADASRSFDLKRFQDNATFFRRTGLPEAIVWGTEWWYYAAKKLGDDSYWKAGLALFQSAHNPATAAGSG